MRILVLTLAVLGSAFAGPVGLDPSTFVDVSSGSATVSGAVGTGHQVWNFTAWAGNSITLDIDVTAQLQGTVSRDDDTELYLFDSVGHQLAYDDDGGEGMSSLISDYLAGYSGTYYAVVTTWAGARNRPSFDANGILTGWPDVGASNVEYNLTISGVAPPPSEVPEPGSVALLLGGLGALAAFGRRVR
ncbi:MAG TPA: PEP-CTERM sorting domain-containing protein [Bryobacteraceae bacterium]|nr:PEP-CTERM sorting domain-containing protein [Bryobacteraceae bacterium]